MMILPLTIGFLLPACVGWLLLDLVEWKVHVLEREEKWALGFVVGMTLSMFVAFFANVLLGVPFTASGFLMVFAALLIALGIPWVLRRKSVPPYFAPLLPAETMPRGVRIAVMALGAWVAVRVLLFCLTLLLVPSFFDDTTDNWNLRGKIFYLQKSFTLQFPWSPNIPGVSSYPPTVPLAKTWLATLAGSWQEGIVNSIHFIWFIALLLLVYWTLRRMLPMSFALLGAIILASLPLELIHGTSAYADVFLSVHLFASVALLVHALRSEDAGRAMSFLRISGLMIALVTFTKNEGWALYFPVLALLFAITALWLWRKKAVSPRALIITALIAGGVILAIVVPWIAFKLTNGLPFGNAKGIDLNFRWQKNVLLSVTVNTFFEGNWGLLFPLFFGLLALRWKTAFRTSVVTLTTFFLIPYLVQMFAYLFTGLSTEALLQTGYARGLIHLMPVIVTITTLLMYDLVTCRPTPPSSDINRT
ncbi:hypothetical protein EXS70_00525 [Candidatus Peribacteria bacterium]|nr:hypothetical protein [Candidatus Peribacteria bacterium]